MKAAIDIGSNSIILILQDEKILKEYFEVTSLGRGLTLSETLDPNSREKSLDALRRYKEICQDNNIQSEEIIITATQALRVAKDSEAFCQEVFNELGLRINIITAEGESYYTLLGILKGSPSSEGKVTILDLGGASTEVIQISNADDKTKPNFVSLAHGSVSTKDRLDLEGSFKLSSFEKRSLQTYKTDQIVCCAGTVNSLFLLSLQSKIFDENAIHNKTWNIFEFESFVEKLRLVPIIQIQKEYPYLKDRAEFLYPGAALALEVFKILEVKHIINSTRGLRHGLLEQTEIKDRFLYGK